MSKLPVIAPEAAPPEPAFDGPLAYASALSPKRIYVDTFGCQMNAHDSQRMVSLMAGEGYAPTDTPDDADLIVLNSCSVREKAEQKLRTRAGQMKRIKRKNRDVVLAIGGCVAQQEGQRMMERIPQADIVFGPDHIASLPDLVRNVREDRQRILRTDFLDREAYAFPAITDENPAEVSAYVSVMKGCDKFCTFCIVPFTRGREVSRSADEIVEEVKKLAGQGSKEIVLLGQTVNSYGRRKKDGHIPFHELLARVASVDGVERVRFTSPHPSDFSDEQIRAFAELPELCPHMHLPVQSGSTKVLTAMRRGYTREEFLAITDRLNEVAPQVALTTDIIVGFPGETEEDFEQTLSLMERVNFQASYSFAYSERVGTRALQIEPEVPLEERMRRLHVLQALQNALTKRWLDGMVGQKQTVMIEGPSKTDATRSTGRNGQNRPVHVDGTFAPGTMLEVEIVEAFNHSLLGRAA
ncbi:MAG: tRNA (N6-isopentenyl adenosine(37)-C2)-methylthiotransferase MiaB [Deltaproteobacteria bacterium]|jgi:tRNA-2-methylthio-N6-dimethylallyladenosine synthase